jgi:hypothetical protein
MSLAPVEAFTKADSPVVLAVNKRFTEEGVKGGFNRFSFLSRPAVLCHWAIIGAGNFYSIWYV